MHITHNVKSENEKGDRKEGYFSSVPPRFAASTGLVYGWNLILVGEEVGDTGGESKWLKCKVGFIGSDAACLPCWKVSTCREANQTTFPVWHIETGVSYSHTVKHS